jgi:hypothetical protein
MTDKLKKIIGLRNIITNGKEWKYLLFYDKDDQTENSITELHECFTLSNTSYLIYKTKAGLHGVGLTPLKIERYASDFQLLQHIIPEYYSGQTIRLSRKEGEKQELLYYKFSWPIIPNLLEIYSKRFFQDKPKEFFEDFHQNLITNEKWHLVFEKYWSGKH